MKMLLHFSYWFNKRFGVSRTVTSRQFSSFHSEDNLASRPSSSSQPSISNGKPNITQLNFIANRVSLEVSTFIGKRPDFTFYRNNLICENRIAQHTTYSLRAYWVQLSTIHVLMQIYCLRAKMEALGIVPFIEDGTVRLRWRLNYVTIPSILYRIFFNPIQWKSITDNPKWFDGYSIFYVGADGLVYKHVIDKVMPDEKNLKSSLRKSPAEKIAEKIGVVPKTTSRESYFLIN